MDVALVFFRQSRHTGLTVFVFLAILWSALEFLKALVVQWIGHKIADLAM